MNEWVAGGLVLLAVPLVWGLMYLGWRGRRRRQGDVAEPADAPAGGDVGDALVPAFDGVYVSTVRHGDWLDRVVVHGLGARSEVTVEGGRSGVWLRRQGARDVFIPAADLVGVSRSRGQAGKFTVEEGMIVLTWRSGAAELDTAVRPREFARAAELERSLAALATGGPA